MIIINEIYASNFRWKPNANTHIEKHEDKNPECDFKFSDFLHDELERLEETRDGTKGEKQK